MSLIKLEDVHKLYQMEEVSVEALKGISLEIDRGSFVSFMGPSGSGKTTLLNLIASLDKPTKGNIFVDGKRIDTFNRNESAKFRGTTLGFIFQNFNLMPVLTVYENVEYPLIMVQNVPFQKRKTLIMNLLEKVGMLDQKDKYPGQISGGQKQRVAIARALVTNPQVVLADEPTANLDHGTAKNVLSIMRKMKEEIGTTFIFSTHDSKILDEVEIIYTIEDGLIAGKNIKISGEEK